MIARAMDALRRAGEEEAGDPPATPIIWLALALALTGLGISTYLTVVHFVGEGALVCSDNGVINCAAVTTSAQSHFLGMPVSVLGLAYYVVVVAINLPPLWRSRDRRVHLARVGLLVVGMAFALYLVSAELLIIDKICIWCTGVHIVTFALFILVMITSPRLLGWGSDDREGLRSRQSAGSTRVAGTGTDRIVGGSLASGSQARRQQAARYETAKQLARQQARSKCAPIRPLGTVSRRNPPASNGHSPSDATSVRQAGRRSSRAFRSISFKPPHIPWGSRMRIA
jgi:uncharacterized membrane protein